MAGGVQGARLGQDGRRHPVGPVDRRGPAGIGGQALAELGPVARVVAELGVGTLELLEGGHERLGDIPATERAIHAPAPGRIGLEQAGVDRRGPERGVGPVEAGGARPLDEQRHPERVLARPLAGDARHLDARRDVHADRRDGEDGRADRRGIEAAAEDDRELAGDGRGEAAVDADARAAGVAAAGRVEEDPLAGAGREVGPGAFDDARGLALDRGGVAVRDRREVDGLPGGPGDRGDGRRWARRPRAGRRRGRGP